MADNTLAYGFASLAQHLSERLSTQNSGLVTRAIQESADEYSRTALMAGRILWERTTLAKERYQQPGAGTLQPIDEFGIPLPVRPGGYYDVAYPIQGGGTSYGRNRITAVLESIADVNRDQLDAETKDADWLIRHALAALLDNTTWTYGDPLLGNLTVQPLAITSDSVTYVRTGGQSSTAQHYLAQTAAIANATNPFPTIYSTLSGYPGNVGRDIVCYVPTNNVADVEALADFVPVADPDVQPGSGSDTLTASAGRLAEVRGMGDMVLGRVNRVWVVEWKRLPENYLLSVVVGQPPLAMREYDDPRLQGLFPEIHSPDGARLERRYLRYAGFGVRNRVAALVYQVEGGDTTYDIPTGYATPLPA